MLSLLTAALLATSPFPAADAKAPAAKPDAKIEAKKDAKTEAKADGVLKRGAPLTGKSAKVAFADVAKQPAKYAGKTVTIEGTVRQACTRKGCWMELAADES